MCWLYVKWESNEGGATIPLARSTSDYPRSLGSFAYRPHCYPRADPTFTFYPKSSDEREFRRRKKRFRAHALREAPLWFGIYSVMCSLVVHFCSHFPPSASASASASASYFPAPKSGIASGLRGPVYLGWIRIKVGVCTLVRTGERYRCFARFCPIHLILCTSKLL